MDGLLLTVGFILQVLSVIWIIFLIRDRRAKRRLVTRDYFIPLRERYGGIMEEKEDFIPKKKMKYHTLEEPIEYYSENEAEDEGCGCATVCNNCYDTTIYDL